jgi:hypothetical protein
MSNTSQTQDEIYTSLMKYYFNNKNNLNPNIIDPYNAINLIQKKSIFSTKELNLIYSQLLNYTYAATAREIKNHEEVNAHLTEIHKLLKKLVKEEPAPAEPPATTGP